MLKKANPVRISQIGFSGDPQPDDSLLCPDSPVPSTTSAPSNSHHPQIIDQDVDDFSTSLNNLISTFRNESMKEFMTMKRNLLHEQVTAIEAERKRCSAQVSARQDEVEHLKEELATAANCLVSTETHKQNLAKFSYKLVTLKNAHKAIKLTLDAWKQYRINKRLAKRLGHIATLRGTQGRMRRIYTAWKARWRAFHLQKAKESFTQAVEYEKNEQSLYYNKEIQLLRARLEETETKLKHEEDSKTQIQESMKKAFLRGVCAMNFEAMSLLNPTAESIPEFTLEEQDEVKENTAEVRSPRKNPLEELHALIPPESKEQQWKPAPVLGRPATAPVIQNSLPSNLHQQSDVQGKTIVVNPNGPEPKVKGHLPGKVVAVNRKPNKKA